MYPLGGREGGILNGKISMSRRFSDLATQSTKMRTKLQGSEIKGDRMFYQVGLK